MQRGGTVDSRGVLDILDAWLGQGSGVLTINDLPFLTYEATGGNGHQITPVVAAWQAIRLALKLFDDVEDRDIGDRPGEATNAATGLLFVAQVALEELSACDVLPKAAQRLRQALGRAVLHACVGQQADLNAGHTRTPSADPDIWLEIAGSKSGELLAWAAWAGAIVAGADDHVASCYHEYGYHLGMLLQVADDFHDVWYPDGTSDLARGCLTLPICYALHMATDEGRARLTRLLDRVRTGDSTAEVAARQMLIDLGAQAYLLAVARVQYQQAVASVQRADGIVASHQKLIALADHVLPALKAACRTE